MQQPNVTVYGSVSCPDTTQAREWLDEHGIPYEYKDVDDDPSYSAYIADLNGGKRVMPTIRVDNRTLVNPSAEELGAAFAKQDS
jgi:glutaredoxin